jgi:uncharacterized protein
MTIAEVLKAKRSEILQAASKRGATGLRVFGSVARQEASESSDVDFLVDLEPGRSLFDLGGLSADLEALLGRKVDVAEVKGLSPYLRDRVLREAVPL